MTAGATPNGVKLVADGLRRLGDGRTPDAVMLLMTTAAVAALPGAVDAALTVRRRRRFLTLASTGELPPAVDALQYEHGGPCVDALMTGGDALLARDLRADERWPTFSRAAVERTSVRSMLSYPLVVGGDDAVASLNLYATEPNAFAAETIVAGDGLAAYAAAVLAYTAEVEKSANLEVALQRNRDIGAAAGILMSRRRIDYDDAVELLKTASQVANRKMHDLAQDVVYTGDLGVSVVAPQRRPDQPVE